MQPRLLQNKTHTLESFCESRHHSHRDDHLPLTHLPPSPQHEHPLPPLRRQPHPENLWQNLWNDGPFDAYGNPTRGRGPSRSAPAEHPYIDLDPYTNRWAQGGRLKSRNFKPRHYWARPVDGKRRGTVGRLKDALTWEGPDVFVVLNGDRRTLHRDRPHRAQWSGWDGPLWDQTWGVRMRGEDPDATWSEDWQDFRRGGWAADRAERYNFRTRKYEKPGEIMQNAMRGKMWTDAHWRDGARRKDKVPESSRDLFGRWETRVPWWSVMYAGGRPGTYPGMYGGGTPGYW